jgi:two-component system CheB/CheR fusion protein
MLQDKKGATELFSGWLEQGSDHAVVLLDPRGIVVAWLAGAELILGFPQSEAVGRHIAFIFTGHDRDKGFPDHELKVAARDSHAEDSRWHVRRDGTSIWVTGTVEAVRAEDQSILGFVKIMRDMTDHRERIERLENELATLEQTRDRTHIFLRTLGHEIRNPLGVLSNTHQILQRLVADERGRKVVEQLGTQVQVLRRLADDLMDVSRLELGKLELECQRVDLRTVLQDAVQAVADATQAKSLKVELLLPPSEMPVQVDPARIQQVVLNLLGNAIKYTPKGGSIWVQATQEAHEYVCRVQDTGIGIPPTVLPELFQLFTQAPEGREMAQGGIGVGLALVRQLVELHGGTVQAKSAGVGKGAEFAFRLPAME